MARRPRGLRIFSTASILLFIPGTSLHGQGEPTGDPSILDTTADLEVLFEGQSRLEGPSIGLDGTIYFVEIDPFAGGRIWHIPPGSREASVLLEPSGLAVGSAIDPDGNLLTAEYSLGGGRRISSINLETEERTTVTDRFGGEPYGAANDLALDDLGRVYFTENDYMGPEEILDPHPPGVYRVDPDGGVHRIIRDAGAPNGIMVSPDQRTLYVGMNRHDSVGNGAVLAYDLAEDGSVEFRSILAIQKAEDRQLADGMAVDVGGNLFVALFSDEAPTGIAVLSPDGDQLAFIPTPGPATNVTFGLGSDATSLYITAGSGLYRFPVKSRGYHPPWRRLR
jgi:gluconolactonase